MLTINDLKLYDVLLSGPMYFYFSTFITHPFLKFFAQFVGVTTILYNGHNMLLKKGVFKKSLITSLLVESSESAQKTNFHRLYNLLLMYPLLFYSNYTTESPIKYIIYMMIIGGFIVNYYNFHYKNTILCFLSEYGLTAPDTQCIIE